MKLPLQDIEKILEWFKLKLYLNYNSQNSSKRIVKRGQVYKCNLGYNIGSEMCKERPVVIIQNDIANLKSSIIVPITHNEKELPCIVPINNKIDENNNILLDGFVNTSNIRVVSKARLGDYICNLNKSELKKFDESIAKSLGIIQYYSKIKKSLNIEKEYIAKLKSEKSKLEEELIEIKNFLNLKENDSIIDYLKSN